MFGRNCAARGARVNMKNDWRSWQTVCFSFFFFFVWMISACNPQSAMTEVSVEPSTTTMEVYPFLVRGCNWLEIIKSDGQFINLFDWSLLWYHGGEQLKKMEWKRLCFFSEIVLSRKFFNTFFVAMRNFEANGSVRVLMSYWLFPTLVLATFPFYG